jgi:hypothetical protein
VPANRPLDGLSMASSVARERADSDGYGAAMGDEQGWDRGPGADRLRRDALTADDPAARPSSVGPRLVDLADEFHLTTGEALEVCARAGIPVAHGGQALTPEAAAHFRETAATPAPTIEQVGPAASWAVPPPSAALPPPAPAGASRPFVPLPIGDAATPTALAGPPWGAPPGVPDGPRRTEPLAIVALVLAFLPLVVAGFGLVAGLLFVVPAVACASAAKKKIGRQPQVLTGRGIAQAAEITAVVCWVLGLAFGFALRSGTVKTPTAVVSDAVTGQDTQNYTNVSVGTCFNTDVPSAGTETVTVGRSITTVDCATPHDAEVFVKSDISVPGNVYPGDEGMRAQVVRSCAPQFEPYTGSPMTKTTLDFGAFFPLASTWSAGDRTLVCFVYVKDKSPVTGSLRGSGR